MEEVTTPEYDSDFIRDVLEAHKNATPLRNEYTISESDIKFFNNYVDGASKLTFRNFTDLLTECPLLVEHDYSVPFLYMLFNLSDKDILDIINAFYTNIRFERTFLHNGNVDHLFFFHNYAILKKAGFRWNPERAHRLISMYKNRNLKTLYSLKDDILDYQYDVLNLNIEGEDDTAVTNDIFSYIFAYCTSGDNNIGGCKFNPEYNEYRDPLRIGRSVSFIDNIVKFYGMTMYGLDEKSFRYITGDPFLYLQRNRGIIAKLEHTHVADTIAKISAKMSLGDFSSYVNTNYGMVPLDVQTAKIYFLHSLCYYAEIELVKGDRNNPTVNDQDQTLLCYINKPFIYKDRQDIIYKFLKEKQIREGSDLYIKYVSSPDPEDPDRFVYTHPSNNQIAIYKGPRRVYTFNTGAKVTQEVASYLQSIISELPTPQLQQQYSDYLNAQPRAQ